MTGPSVRYQVFVSSTYEDLREERQQVTQAILEANSFPSGMELFPASDDNQWELIRRVIEECDYYVVIVGGRYGSVASSGKSYTEMEYDYAVSCGIPVLGFVKDNLEDIPAKFVESDADKLQKLRTFREKVMSRSCRKFKDPHELGMLVMKSLMHEIRVRPQTGWVKASEARSPEDRRREDQLRKDLEEAENKIAGLERKLRDRSVLTDEIHEEDLAQGDDIFVMHIGYRDNQKKYVSREVELAWDEIFQVIGPSMYGYILKKTTSYNAPTGRYPFEDELENYIRRKVVNESQNRKIDLQQYQIDKIVFQFKELGLICFHEQENDAGDVFRGITLTERGEKKLAELKTEKRTY